MMKGLGHLSCEENLSELGEEDAERNLINIYEYLNRGCRGERAKLFSVVPGDRTRGSGHQLEHGSFLLNIRKHFLAVWVTESWHKLPREAVGCLPLETFSSCLDMVLGTLLKVSLLEKADWSRCATDVYHLSPVYYPDLPEVVWGTSHSIHISMLPLT